MIVTPSIGVFSFPTVWMSFPPIDSPAAMDALSAYPWPGNVRELENIGQLRQSSVG